MPLYEYECTTCHRRIEKIQKFSDAELTVCPHCSGRLERTVTAPAFQFAGGGWYKDGYGSAKPAAGSNDAPSADAAGKDSGSKASSSNDSSASTAAETKPVAAAPAAPAPTPAAKP